MTAEQLQKLTPEAKQIAIAEACGWKPLPIGELWEKDGRIARADGRPGHNNVPDYRGDLNAMHAAEETLAAQWKTGIHEQYSAELYRILAAAAPMPGMFEIAHASAAQRADAFLLAAVPDPEPEKESAFRG